MKSLKMFPNLPEIYICYALFYMGEGGGVTKNPQESRVKEIHYGVKRKQLSFWEKLKLNNSLKNKKFNIMRDTESNFVSVYLSQVIVAHNPHCGWTWSVT